MTTFRGLPDRPEPTAPGMVPGWLPLAEKALTDLLSLPADWNSYGAHRIDPEIVRTVSDLLRRIVQPNTPRPNVVPTVHGGVQLEWHTGGVDLELEFTSPELIQAFYEESGQAIESELDPCSDLSELTDWIARLSHAA